MTKNPIRVSLGDIGKVTFAVFEEERIRLIGMNGYLHLGIEPIPDAPGKYALVAYLNSQAPTVLAEGRGHHVYPVFFELKRQIERQVGATRWKPRALMFGVGLVAAVSMATAAGIGAMWIASMSANVPPALPQDINSMSAPALPQADNSVPVPASTAPVTPEKTSSEAPAGSSRTGPAAPVNAKEAPKSSNKTRTVPAPTAAAEPDPSLTPAQVPEAPRTLATKQASAVPPASIPAPPLPASSSKDPQLALAALEAINTALNNNTAVSEEMLALLPPEMAQRLREGGIAMVGRDENGNICPASSAAAGQPSIANVPLLPAPIPQAVSTRNFDIPLPGGGDIERPEDLKEFGLKL